LPLTLFFSVSPCLRGEYGLRLAALWDMLLSLSGGTNPTSDLSRQRSASMACLYPASPASTPFI
jgi:hypothetical protein